MKILATSFSLVFLGCVTTYAQGAQDIFSQLAVIDNAAPGAPVYKSAESTNAAIEKCSHENIKTEFDTTESLLTRISKAPCTFVGVTTFRGRGDSLAGDILKYDPVRQIAYWNTSLGISGDSRYGQIALPDNLQFGGGDKTRIFTKEQRQEMNAVKKTSYLFLPLCGVNDVMSKYDATNGFGAHVMVTSLKGVRYSLALNMGKEFMVGESFRIASISMPRDKAPDLIPNLDVQLYWVTAKPCEACLTGGQIETTPLGGPNFDNPIDIHLVQNYVFAKLVAVRFVDRRDGKTYAVSAGDQSFFPK